MDLAKRADDSSLPTGVSYDTINRYHDTLLSFLRDHLQRDHATVSRQRKTAQEKLSKLSKVQFHELGTDVFDEIIRRQINSLEVPFLPVRPEFHPKRNQARQKLATLSVSKFKDLSTDVFYELERRFPSTRGASAPSPTRSDNESAKGGVASSIMSRSVVNSGAISPEDQMPTPSSIPANNFLQKTASASGHVANIDDDDIKSLDNLMDDLGQILKNKKSKSKDLTSQDEKLDSNIERLEDMVSEQSKIIDQQEKIIEELDKKYKSLQKRYEEQEKQGDRFREESDDLITEIKSLTKKIEVMQSEREMDRASVKTLLAEKSSLDHKLKEAQLEIKRLLSARSNSEGAFSEPRTSEYEASSTGSKTAVSRTKALINFEVNQEYVSNYMMSIDELLQAIRSTVAGNILMSMKSIVICVRKISENVDDFEGTLKGLENDMDVSEKFDRLSIARNLVSTCLSDLISTAKDCAKDPSSLNSKKADESASALTTSIVELIAMIKNIIASTNGNANGQNNKDVVKNSGKEIIERDTDAIVHNIQEFLTTLRNTDEIADLYPIVSHIKTSCSNVLKDAAGLSSSSLKKEFSKNIKFVMEDLEMYSHRLGSYFEGGSVDAVKDGKLDKISKQRLAAAAYDIAKSTKELVALFDI